MTQPDLRAQFHNVTIYVARDQVAPAAEFYREVLGLPVAFAEPGHIACFELLGYEAALCIHEEEQGHPAGTTQLYFWADDPAAVARRAPATQTSHNEEWQLADGAGTGIIVHRGAPRQN